MQHTPAAPAGCSNRYRNEPRMPRHHIKTAIYLPRGERHPPPPPAPPCPTQPLARPPPWLAHATAALAGMGTSSHHFIHSAATLTMRECDALNLVQQTTCETKQLVLPTPRPYRGNLAGCHQARAPSAPYPFLTFFCRCCCCCCPGCCCCCCCCCCSAGCISTFSAASGRWARGRVADSAC